MSRRFSLSGHPIGYVKGLANVALEKRVDVKDNPSETSLTRNPQLPVAGRNASENWITANLPTHE